MSWWLAGAAIVNAIMGERAGDRADAATAETNRLTAEQLEFAREEYADWQEMFGPVLDNLKEFALAYTPEVAEAEGLQEVQSAFSRLRTELPAELARRGISDDDGLALTLDRRLELKQAEAESGVRVGAKERSAAVQQNFLSIGANARNPHTQTVMNAMNTGINRSAQLEQQAWNEVGQFAQNFGNILMTAGQNFGRGQTPATPTASTPTTVLT